MPESYIELAKLQFAAQGECATPLPPQWFLEPHHATVSNAMNFESHFRHNTLIPEHPCSGEVIEREEFSTGQVHAICSSCGTEFQYVLGSDWGRVISPWMRRPV
jgi:hypothetical protein